MTKERTSLIIQELPIRAPVFPELTTFSLKPFSVTLSLFLHAVLAAPFFWNEVPLGNTPLSWDVLFVAPKEVKTRTQDCAPAPSRPAVSRKAVQALSHRVVSTDAEPSKNDSISESISTQVMPLPGNPAPAYPEEAREKGIEGEVRLRLTIQSSGTIGKIDVLSTPHPLLTHSAVDAVKLWRFMRGTKESVKEIPIRFELERAQRIEPAS